MTLNKAEAIQNAYTDLMQLGNNPLPNYNGIITTCEHNHPGGSKNDAVAPPKEYLEAAKNAGYKKFAVTDHGSFTSMQTLIDNAKKYDIEIIYGVEAYVEVPPFSIDDSIAHLILLAKDETGKHIIDNLNSHATLNKHNMPVILWDTMIHTEFNQHVIATSACVSGAPALHLRMNDILDKRILRTKKDLDEACSEDENGEVKALDPNCIAYKSILSKWTDVNTKLASTKFTDADKTLRVNLKRQIRDLKKQCLDYSLLEAQVSNLDNKESNIKMLQAQLKSERKLLKIEFDEASKKVDNYNKFKAKIDAYEAQKKPFADCLQSATECIKTYAQLFGKNHYYIELQNHGLEMERIYIILASLAKKLNLPVVAANDAHMPTNSQRNKDMRNVARFLRFLNISEEEADNELYIKTPNELALWLSKILPTGIVDEAMRNLNVIGEMCNYKPSIESHYPVYDKSKDSQALLREKAFDGIKWRYPNNEGWDSAHLARLEHELNTICSMGFADYFLIVQDFLEYARICGKVPLNKLHEVPLSIEGARKYASDNNYHVGVGTGRGRGSGAGSLVTFVLGITEIDPFKYDLYFERFLNPERISMPDIDSDIAPGVREKTIDYVKEKYGHRAVVGIITEQREGVKGAIRDAARYLGKKKYDDAKYFTSLYGTINKKVPEEVNISFNTTIDDSEVTVYDFLLKEYGEHPNKEDIYEILAIAKNLEGMLTNYGQHAAGVIIYDNEDITEYIPTKEIAKGEFVTECDMIQAEAIKLLKMDFLGLKTLGIITDTLRLIEEQHGITISDTDIKVDDEKAQKVYDEIYAKGRTKNVFQFESAGMRKYLKQLLS